MKRELIFTFCCLLTTLVWSQEYQRTETGIKASIFGKKIDVEVQWFNANSLRVLKMPHGQSVDKKSLSVIARPEKTVLKVSTSEDGNIVMKSRLLTVKLDTKTGVLIYETRNGMPLLKELENVKAFIPVNDAGRATYSVYQSFKTDKDEGLYGLGQLQNVSVSAILSCRPFFILIFLPCIKMNHYGFSRKSIWKNLETFP